MDDAPPDPAASPTPSLRVGPWTVDPPLLEIRRDGEVRRLGPKVMAVLLDLAHRPGRVVSRDDLVRRVWAGAFTSDEAVAAVVYELRKVLDDDARQPRYLETIRGSGYRLIAAVEPRLPAAGPEAEPPVPEEERPRQSRRPARAGRRRAGLLGALVLLVLLAAVWLLALRPGPRELAVAETTEGVAGPAVSRSSPARSLPIRSLAVLPLGNVSGEAPQDLFAETLTDMLIGDVAQLCPVDVAPGISVRRQGQRWSLDQAVEVLGVDAVVEGSVLRSGDRFWISVQMVDTATGRMLWSGTYDRQLGDDLFVLRDVALEIAREIQAVITPPAP